MSDHNENENNNPGKDLFGGLKDITDRFLKNLSDTVRPVDDKVQPPSSSVDQDALNRFKNKIRARQPFRMSDMQDVTSSAKDAFEEGLNRLRRLREAPATLDQDQPQPLSKSSLPPRPSVEEGSKMESSQDQPCLDPSQEIVAPSDLMDRMKRLLSRMTQKEMLTLNSDWTAMDVLSSQLRSAWVKTLSDKKQGPVVDFLKEWSSIVQSIRTQSKDWGVHAPAWQAWSSQAQEDIGVLALWLKVDPLSLSVDHAMPLKVPSEYAGTGSIPTPARNTPEELIQDLQELADYWEYAQHQSSIVWHNTPHELAVQESLDRLNAWQATTARQKAWKESALDAYTVLSGKMVLLQSRPTPSPSSSSPKF